ncbi:hypothetical protein HTZ84_21215 [Haloterrigena sp. SYSU A558-1]|uniref:Uncharacterized protein n=1 Tax=Haloterrigena gelatinilytica TaxID=2741724 RepID=A0ABX2LGF8_9EURY|nr:hypothetical protein [Haloterrigena gelatinilytica]NUC74786.1 hypothetical protein [Haloterrigena gelatinilytica]
MVDVATVLLAVNAVVLITGRFQVLRRLYVATWFLTLVPAVFLFVYTMHLLLIVPHLALFPAVITVYLPVAGGDRNRDPEQEQLSAREQEQDTGGDGYRMVPSQRIFEDVDEIEETYRQ